MDFLLEHGASLDCVDGGVNQALEFAVLTYGPCPLVEFLFQHEATLREVPLGLETVVDRAVLEGHPWNTIWFVLDNGGPLRYRTPTVEREMLRLYRSEALSPRVQCLVVYVPGAFNILGEDTILCNHFYESVDMLLREVGSDYQVTSAASRKGNHHHNVLARALLQAGAYLAKTNRHDFTPLHRAAHLGCTEIVKALVKKGALLNQGDGDRRTPLWLAASNGMHEIIAILLDAGADPTIANNSRRCLPLHLAASFGHLEATRVLKQCAHLDLDTPNKAGWIALFRSCMKGMTDIVRLLLDAGADPYFGNHDGLTPIHAAASGGHVETVTMLVNRKIEPGTSSLPSGETPLHCPVGSGHLGVVKALIAHGANLAATTEDGQTALHRAPANGHVDVVNLLRGSKQESPIGDGRTALHWACRFGHLDVVKTLIETHADLTVQDKALMSPMMLAAGNGHRHVVQFLIDQGVDPDAANSEGFTPLSIAAMGGHANVLQRLIDKHVQVNTMTSEGVGPLCMAALRSHLDAVKILAASQADVNARGPGGLAALHIACALGHIEMVQVLVDHGAHVNLGSTDG